MSEQITAYKCLHCGHIQEEEFEVCPNCSTGPVIFSEPKKTATYIHKTEEGQFPPIVRF